MNKNYFFLALGCALLLTSCVKDEPDATFIKLFAESYTPDGKASKAAVSGNSAYWVDGEDVSINGHVYTVRSGGTGNAEAYVDMTWKNTDGVYYGVYPAGVYDSRSGSNFTINVPNQYAYEIKNGKQILEGLPMVAYCNLGGEGVPESLDFKHLTAAITVRIKNEYSHDIVLDRVEISNNEYQLAGKVTVNMTNATAANVGSLIGPHTYQSSNTEQTNTVSVSFSKTKVVLAAAEESPAAKDTDADESGLPDPVDHVDVQIPILPVGSENSQFTIKIYGHKVGSRYTHEQTQPSARNNAIDRAELGYAVIGYPSEGLTADPLFEVTQITVDGEQKDFFEIGTPDELINFITAMENEWHIGEEDDQYLYSNYVITEDIDLDGAVIDPIRFYNKGNTNPDNRCYFDGQDNTISDFTLSTVGDVNNPNICGLFASPEGDYITISNLNVEDATYIFKHTEQKIEDDKNPSSSVGGLMGLIDNKKGIEISNCSIDNLSIKTTEDAAQGNTDLYVGGIVGYVYSREDDLNTITIEGCYLGTVTFENNEPNHNKVVDQFGGAIGRVDVKPNYNAGGATHKFVTIKDFTYNQGETPLVIANSMQAIRYGGVISSISEGDAIELNNCSVTHNVILPAPSGGKLYAAGLIGMMRSSNQCGLKLTNGNEVAGRIEYQYNNMDLGETRQINKIVSGEPATLRNKLKKCAGSESDVSSCTLEVYKKHNSEEAVQTTFWFTAQTLDNLTAMASK